MGTKITFDKNEEAWRIPRLLEVLHRMVYNTQDDGKISIYNVVKSIEDHKGSLIVVFSIAPDKPLEDEFKRAWESINEYDVEFQYDG